MSKAKERTYAEHLKSLGVYNEAFDSAIHELCILERELSRARRELSKKYPQDKYKAFTDPLYTTVRQINTAVLSYKDSLGLTPKGLQKLKGKLEEAPTTPAPATTLGLILQKHEHARKSNPPA